MPTAHEIFVPQTTVSSPENGKPFTQYHVVIQLPLRKIEILRRFSEFETLHVALEKETNFAPPVALPSKSWFRRTVNNEALTEERRVGLENYVQAIIEAENPRWRSSTAWRKFISPTEKELPLSSLKTDKVKRTTSDGYADPGYWLERHRELKDLMQKARHRLKQREAATTVSQQHSCSADAKASLVLAATTVAHLENGLNQMTQLKRDDQEQRRSSIQTLGDGELRRRGDLVTAAKSEIEGLEGVLKSMVMKNLGTTHNTADGVRASEGDKNGLWTSTTIAKSKGRVLGGPLKETTRTRELDNNGVLQLQQQVLKEQDEDVLLLGKTVARLKDMGLMINEELTIQNEMLGLLEEDTDRVQSKINVARGRINKIK